MKNQIYDTLLNIFVSLACAFIVILTAWCLPRIIVKLPALPTFTTSLWEFSALQLFGFVPIIIGSLIILWCYRIFIFYGKGTPIHFKLPQKLVVKGLYRFVRNPQIIGYDLLWIGNSLIYQSFLLLIIAVIQHMVIFQALLVPFEEDMLESRFGESYKRYCEKVPRWIPRITPYKEIS